MVYYQWIDVVILTQQTAIYFSLSFLIIVIDRLPDEVALVYYLLVNVNLRYINGRKRRCLLTFLHSQGLFILTKVSHSILFILISGNLCRLIWICYLLMMAKLIIHRDRPSMTYRVGI